MKKILLIVLVLSVGFGITPTQHPFDVKNLHSNELNDFLPFEDEDSQIRLERMSIGDWNLLRRYSQDWENSEWVNDEVNTYTYDENNNLIESLRQSWENSEWVNSQRYTYTYDTNNNRIEYLYQNWENSEWVNGGRYTYTYDVNNNQVESLGQNWQNSEWVNGGRNTQTYDVNNNLIEILSQNWQNSEWVNGGRNTQTYDVNNNLIEILSQNWDGSEWVNGGRNTYTYDVNNNRIEYLYQNWENSEWVNWGRYTYTYDENNNLIESLGQNWQNSEWVDNWRYIQTYDVNNNQVESLGQNWQNSEWVNGGRNTQTYDENNNQIESFLQDWVGSEWVNDRRYTYIYCEQGTECYPYDSFGNCIAIGDKLDENGLDCSGECGGSNIPEDDCCEGSVLDECGVCGGDNSICLDCAGVPNGDSFLDCTNVNCFPNEYYYYLGDGWCDDGTGGEDWIDFNCPDHNCDGGDCGYAIDDETGECVDACDAYDCFGNCYKSNLLGFSFEFNIGDGYCDDGTPSMWNFACDEHDCDGGDCLLDECGVCGGDNSTCTGCMDEDACNYDIDATIEGECQYAEENYNCDGTCITDTDGDDVCDELEVIGCQDETACNYDATATDSGDCVHTDGVCDTCVEGEIVDNDSDDDTVCDDMDVCEGYDDTVDSDGDGTPDGCDLSIYEGIIPDNYNIASIYPNPFNPVTSITYGLPENTDIQITVYDMGGTHITTLENTFQTAGYHTINWNASSFPSGVYLIRMDSGDFTQTQKVVLVK